MQKLLEIGDYVMASKYTDGDAKDHFAIGFYSGKLMDRYMVKDGDGNLFRANGFRRCERISKKVGDVLVKYINIMEQASCSVWYWRYHPSQLEEIGNL